MTSKIPPFHETTLEQERAFLAEHLAARPEIPKPLPPAMSPAFRAWEKARTTWALQLEMLEVRVRIKEKGPEKQVGTPWRGERMCG